MRYEFVRLKDADGVYLYPNPARTQTVIVRGAERVDQVFLTPAILAANPGAKFIEIGHGDKIIIDGDSGLVGLQAIVDAHQANE